jgi:hypothetical protein
MGHIKFKDVLIKRWQTNEKMNVMGGMFKDKKKWENHRNQLCLLLEVMRIFKVLEFTTIWVQRVQLKNYNK